MVLYFINDFILILLLLYELLSYCCYHVSCFAVVTMYVSCFVAVVLTAAAAAVVCCYFAVTV